MPTLLNLLPLAVMAHASFTKIPSGNGFGTVVYDAARAKVAALREHTFQSVDESTRTRDLLYDAYFGLRAGAKQSWLNAVAVDSADLDGGVITVRQRYGGLTATQRFFAPLGVAAPSLVMVIEIKNETNAPVDDVRVFSLANAHLGDGDGTIGQRVDWDRAKNAFLHRSTKSQRVMLVKALTPPARHATNPQNPYTIVQSGQLLPDVDTSGDTNDVASGFQFDVGRLAPGATAAAGVLLAYHPFNDVNYLEQAAKSHLGARQPPEVVAKEQQDWGAWLGKARLPGGLSADERRLYLQQLAILRMAQCREPNPQDNPSYRPNGQIVASLYPGQWDVTWVRDGTLALVALARAGYLDEARAGLEFMLRAEAGLYQKYVGRSYRISTVRYYGKGKEESDFNQNGPNIEFDGFGLFLWAFGEYLDAGGDPKLVDTWWSALSEGIADVLVALQEPGGLLSPDSSIWESHWDNGGRQHYTYSNVWAVVGLERAAGWADSRDGVRAARYRLVAQQIKAAIGARLVSGDSILRPSIENFNTVDAAAVEAFNLGILDPTGKVAQATLDAFKKHLFLPITGHGYKRNQNGDLYDEREWVVIDLRIANALRRLGRPGEAEALWGWVRDQALANRGLIAELYDQKTADYAGEVPMIGFGGGAFILAAWERAPKVAPGDGGIADAATPADLASPGEDGPAPAPGDGGPRLDLAQAATDGGQERPGPGGCTCALAPRGHGCGPAPLLALALLAWARRRRR